MKFLKHILWQSTLILAAVACGGTDATSELNSQPSRPALSEEDPRSPPGEAEEFELESCSIARPGDCLRPPSGTKKVTLCGYDLNVPILSYVACQGFSSVLPASCTAGSALTAGGACAANFAMVASTCAVSIATVEQAAECCIKGGCK